MPTPSDNDRVSNASPTTHSCPPEDEHRSNWSHSDVIVPDGDFPIPIMRRPAQQPTPPPPESQTVVGPTDSYISTRDERKQVDPAEDENIVTDMLSPVSLEGDKQDDCELPARNGAGVGSSVEGYDFSNVRLTPSTPSSYLRPGSRFHGIQKSERQEYEVQVEIKHVDMRESFLCGYLRIQGLTEDHPSLTTYFEGEIIGSKYTFLTQHQDWGSTDKVDLQHWGQFSAFRPFQKQARKSNFHIPQVAQKENIFMRWKEHFLVPDHRVRTLSGASFEGFYYICFNQLEGKVDGIYFHAKSERFQQLRLTHVENKGCYAAQEFR